MPATDIRTFGRLGDGVAGTSRRTARRRHRVSRRADAGSLVARRRGRVPRPVGAVAVVLLIGLLWVGSAAARQAGDAPSSDATVVPTRPGEDDRASRTAATPDAGQTVGTFATVNGLALTLPHVDPVVVAFREAKLPAALALEPVGRVEANDNASRFTPPADTDGPGYRVLASRGSGRPATSAVDVVVPAGSAVTAPVTGTVVEVREYALAGGSRDWRVVVESADRPHLSVVLVHLEQPAVAVGDAVEAGTTPIGTARVLPFTSGVDAVVDERSPYVHVEVKPSTRLEPVDPNAQALEPEQAGDAG